MRVRSREIFHEKVVAEVGMKADRSTWGAGYQFKQWTNGSVVQVSTPSLGVFNDGSELRGGLRSGEHR
jgi:hypothetical protein